MDLPSLFRAVLPSPKCPPFQPAVGRKARYTHTAVRPQGSRHGLWSRAVCHSTPSRPRPCSETPRENWHRDELEQRLTEHTCFWLLETFCDTFWHILHAPCLGIQGSLLSSLSPSSSLCFGQKMLPDVVTSTYVSSSCINLSLRPHS